MSRCLLVCLSLVAHSCTFSTTLTNIVHLQLCPSLLVKKDRGRPIDPKARPKAYGEVTVATDVSGVELLQTVDNDEQDGDHSDDSACSVSDNDQQNDMMSINDDDDDDDDDEESQLCSDDDTESDDDEARGTDAISEDEDESSDFEAGDSDTAEDVDDKGDDNDEEDDVSDHEEDGEQAYLSDGSNVETKSKLKVSAKKRKFTDFDGQIIAADTSLRALKKLAGAKVGDVLPESQDGILSNEDFQRIKKLKVSLAYSVSSIFNVCGFC